MNPNNNLVIDLGKTSKLKFENTITGTTSKPFSFFNIPIDENLSLTIKGKDKTENDKLISEIEIPPLNDFFDKSKTIEDVKLQIQVSKSLFTPWKGIMEIKKPLNVETCLKESVSENSNELGVQTVSVSHELIESKDEIKTSSKKFNAKKYTNDYI